MILETAQRLADLTEQLSEGITGRPSHATGIRERFPSRDREEAVDDGAVREAELIQPWSVVQSHEPYQGVSGRLVGPAAFKAVAGSLTRPLVGSIPIHSRQQT